MCDIIRLDAFRKVPRKRTRAEQAMLDHDGYLASDLISDCGQAMLDYAETLRRASHCCGAEISNTHTPYCMDCGTDQE